MDKWIVVMKIQPSICLDDWGKPRKKTQSDWSAPGFEPGTSRMRVLCVAKNNVFRGFLRKWALLMLQTFRHFTYVTAHSPTLPSFYLRHSSFPNPSVASPTSQLILQPFFRFSYVTGASLTSPGEPPMGFTGFLNPKIAKKLVIFQGKCRVGTRNPLLLIKFNVSRDLKPF